MEHLGHDPVDEPLVPIDLNERALENAQTASTDSARLLEERDELEELEPAEDPFDLLEASAAIAAQAGGDNGGGSFVQLLRINESTDGNASLDLSAVSAVRDGDLTRFSNAPPQSSALPTRGLAHRPHRRRRRRRHDDLCS